MSFTPDAIRHNIGVEFEIVLVIKIESNDS